MKLNTSEMNLMQLIWESEPLRSGELVTLANENLGWKKSTVYTVLKHLIQKGVAQNNNSVVTSSIQREEQLSEQSDNIVKKAFGGSLPVFLTAFLNSKKLSVEEAEELKKLIDKHTEER